METQSLSLQELADLTGIEPRTIRSYVQQGVIAGPDTRGRAARYPRDTLDRLKVFRLLRDAHRDLSVDTIRKLLDDLSPTVLADLAAGRRAIAEAIPIHDLLPGSSKALLYLQSLPQPEHRSAVTKAQIAWSAPDARDATGAAPPPPEFTPSRRRGSTGGDPSAPPHTTPKIDLPKLERAAVALAKLVGGSPARAARSTAWHRIPLTPDVELSVRGDVSPEQLAWLHRVADSLRLLLMKGPVP